MEDISKHNFIIFCGDGHNALGIIRSLGEKGISPIILLVDSERSIIKHSKYATNIKFVKSRDDAYECLKTYESKEYKPFIFCTDDYNQEYIDLHYNDLKEYFYFYNCGQHGRLSFFLNKSKMCELAETVGLKSPKWEVIKKGEFPKKIHYPVITKTITSNDGGWKNDVFICYDEQQLSDAYINIQAETLLLQEYIEKKTEIEIQGISLNGGETVFLPYFSTNIRFSKSSYGAYRQCEKFTDAILYNKIKSLIRKIRFSGLFEVEFLVDKNDDLFFLEVNLRSSASNYWSTTAGVNLPYLWALSTINGNDVLSNINLRERPLVVINELADFSQSVVSKKISFAQWINDVWNADSYYLFNKKDLKPFFSVLKRRLIKKIRFFHK